MAKTRIFKSGNSQAVRIPKEFQFDVDEVEIIRSGEDIILRKPATSLTPALKILAQFSGDFHETERVDPPAENREPLA